MTICPACQTSYPETDLNYCGRCGAEMRRARDGAQAADTTIPQDAELAATGPTSEISSPAAVRQDDAMLGRVVGGRYRILERLGAGGMGVVYKVEHVVMGKIAALKMLHPSLVTDREVAKRFQREAQAVSVLTHPNTVQVFDFGSSQGSLYMVMEYLRGEDLAAILEREGPLPWRRAAPLLGQICDALSEAHEHGIIHRDLKPENVMVVRTRDGRDHCKVLDFGLAKLRRPGEIGGVTSRGTLVGTPFYMSPEQIRAEEPDARSDIYSFGALMYRVLTGEYPFAGRTPLAVLSMHLGEALVPPSTRRPDLRFDPRVEHIIQRCMEKDCRARYQSIDEVRQAIEAARSADPSPLPAPGALRTPTPQEATSFAVTPVPGPPPRPLETVAEVARREDFDEFERSLRRRRWLGSLMLPLMLGALVAGPWLLVKRFWTPRPLTEEKEPNSKADLANLIAAGQPVRGRIGTRLDVDSSDRDFYRLHLDAVPEGAILDIELSGIPNMDLRLGLFDGSGKRLAGADTSDEGGGEHIVGQRVAPGDYYLEVREVRIPGRQATENVSDWYTLAARLRTRAPGEESEPDDAPEMAMRIAPGEAAHGYLDREDDIDVYRPASPGGGVLAGEVSGVEGMDLILVVLPPDAPASAHPDKLPGARVFDAGAVGAGERFGGIAWPTGAPAPYVVVLSKERPELAAERASGHDHALARGPVSHERLARPYTLTLSLTPR